MSNHETGTVDAIGSRQQTVVREVNKNCLYMITCMIQKQMDTCFYMFVMVHSTNSTITQVPKVAGRLETNSLLNWESVSRMSFRQTMEEMELTTPESARFACTLVLPVFLVENIQSFRTGTWNAMNWQLHDDFWVCVPSIWGCLAPLQGALGRTWQLKTSLKYQDYLVHSQSSSITSSIMLSKAWLLWRGSLRSGIETWGHQDLCREVDSSLSALFGRQSIAVVMSHLKALDRFLEFLGICAVKCLLPMQRIVWWETCINRYK